MPKIFKLDCLGIINQSVNGIFAIADNLDYVNAIFTKHNNQLLENYLLGIVKAFSRRVNLACY